MAPNVMTNGSNGSKSNYSRTIYYGTFLHLPRVPDISATPNSPPKYRLIVNHGALWVNDATGRIEGFNWNLENESGLYDFIERNGWKSDGKGHPTESVRIVRQRHEKNGFFFPGFVDTHIHAPQYPNSGIFGSSTLLDWLETYTFPLESSFGNKETPELAPQSAHTAYNRVVSRTLSHGTTCAAYFATIHVPATNLLADICRSRGQRAFIGRVCMDNTETCRDYYRDECSEQSITATKASIAHIRSIDPDGHLVRPVITPRFALSCTAQALSELGALAASTSPPTYIQTHISENKDEIQRVLSQFPDCSSYAEVYDKAALLTPHTILAHGIHLTKAERDLIRSRGSSISHCPASNSAIGSGLCPVRTLLDDGIPVGLGTDVSGGYSPSILEAARQACLVSRLLSFQNGNSGEKTSNTSGREKLSVEEVLYLATRGGAKAVRMEDDIGGFEVGMLWDAQMIELGAIVGEDDDGDEGKGSVDLFGWENWEEKLAKWMWSGDDRNVKAVWVGGQLVHENISDRCTP
ncbi:guanine deaminase [Coccidioides immitis H538.4]|uniref:Probable guanine deaminase n=1 Tax=Coccidioides immitis H538.4 TaxID=396776 RepID=A0A0J8S008_COCIT|nr:guanine deaminase [Coccidioides immitis H538.4]